MALSTAFPILAVELDSGTLFLADRRLTLGRDRLIPAVLSLGDISTEGCTFSLEAQALPPEVSGQYWTNREAALLEVTPDMGSVYDGRMLFDGVIAGEPGEVAGVLSLNLAPRHHRVVSLPAAGVIDSTTYPLASSEAVGKQKPLIFGALEACPLLPVRLPPSSVLSDTAYPGDVSLNVESTADFDSVGAVWVGDTPIQYTSKTATTLNGLTVAAELSKGTPVVKAGTSTFMAASHPVAISNPQVAGHAVAGGEQQAEGLAFTHRPLVTTSGSAMNYLAQFDQVASGANTVQATITYPAGETITAAAGTLVTTQSSGASVQAATDQTRTLGLPYKITGWTRIEPAAYSQTKYPLFVVSLSASVSVAATAGVEVDITLTHSDAVDASLSKPGVWVSNVEPSRFDRVNGSVVDGSARVTSSGSVSITSEISLLLGLGDDAPRIGLTVINAALKVGNTLDQLIQGLNRATVAVSMSALTTPAAKVNWRQSASGTPLTQAPATSATTPARESASCATLGNLAVSILPPSSVTAGNYTFSVFVATQSRQDLTNPAPVYTATLGGVSFAVPKEGGTVNVVVPVTPGVPVALVHTVCHDVDMSAELISLFDGQPADLPQGAFASAIGLIVPQIRTVDVTWSNATIDKPALNAVNAIRAITGTVNQNASGWDTSIASAGQGNIVFPRPSADRIVSGYATVNYSVAINGYGGAVGVSIGGQNVYYAEGGNPVYSWSPCTVEITEDVDLLPVVQTGGVGQVVVTINSANRTVLTGNIDGGKYATLKHPNNTKFRAVQLDQMPPRGRFKKARLFVEWFMGGIKGAATPDVRVSFGGKHRGSLNLIAPAGSTTSKTVTVDSASAGNVSIPSLYVPQAVSGAVGALAHSSIPQAITIPAAFSYPFDVGGVFIRRGFSLVPPFTGWDSSLGGITVKVQVQTTGSAPNDIFKWVDIRRANNTVIQQVSASGGSWVNVATNVFEVTYTIWEAPNNVYWSETNSGDGTSMVSVTFSYSARLTSTAVSQSNNLYVGPQGNTGTGTASGPAVSVTLGNNAINVTVPDAPRTTVTEFPLAEITDWGQLTGQVCEIEYTAGVATLDVHLVQVQIAIDYDDETRVAVGDSSATLTADVIGLSGNPADVLTYIASTTGQALEAQATRRLRDWCETNAYVFGRRLADPTDALTLLTYAAEQAGVLLAKRGDALAPVRWFDMGGEATEIREEDCLQAAQIGWADRVETSITLNYREDLTGSNGFTKTILANSTNNAHCRRGLAALRIDAPVSLDAGWIRDDATASQYLAYYARRYGQPRRVLTLDCTFAVSADVGDLIAFYPLHAKAGEHITARITARTTDDGWPTLTAEELLD